jgi:hypothetical protein
VQGLLSGYSLSVEMDILFVALCILSCPEDCFCFAIAYQLHHSRQPSRSFLNQHKDVELGGFLAGTGLIIPTSCTKTLQIEDHQASGLGVASADMAEVCRGI